ncbi:hypothetical protein JNK13_01635 [bacterium]|nr:hypothetical protein [bacterium]
MIWILVILFGFPTFFSLIAAMNKNGYAFVEPSSSVKTAAYDQKIPRYEVIYIGGVNSTDDKFQRHVDTLAAQEVEPVLQDVRFYGFRNNSAGIFDWFEVVSWGYPLNAAGIKDPMTSYMTDALAQRVLESKSRYVILIGHSQGAQFARQVANQVLEEQPDRVDRLAVVYIEPFLVRAPNKKVPVVTVKSAGGHKLDSYLQHPGLIGTALQEVSQN